MPKKLLPCILLLSLLSVFPPCVVINEGGDEGPQNGKYSWCSDDEDAAHGLRVVGFHNLLGEKKKMIKTVENVKSVIAECYTFLITSMVMIMITMM